MAGRRSATSALQATGIRMLLRESLRLIAARLRVPVLGPSRNGAASGPRWLAAALLANVPL